MICTVLQRQSRIILHSQAISYLRSRSLSSLTVLSIIPLSLSSACTLIYLPPTSQFFLARSTIDLIIQRSLFLVLLPLSFYFLSLFLFPPLSLSCSRFAVLSLQRLTFLFLYNFPHYLFDFLSLILSSHTIVYQTISSECFSPLSLPLSIDLYSSCSFCPCPPFFPSFLPSPISFSSTCIFAFGFSSSRKCVISIVFSQIAYQAKNRIIWNRILE